MYEISERKICNIKIQIEALILKEFSVDVLLTIIFNKYLKEGNILSDWKKADVTAIFKKGDKTNLGNYRQVNLIICEVLESFIKDQIQTSVELFSLATAF